MQLESFARSRSLPAAYTTPANGSAHWSVHTAAAQIGTSTTSVARYFQLSGLQPHRSVGLKLSTDLFFIGKLRDVVACT